MAQCKEQSERIKTSLKPAGAYTATDLYHFCISFVFFAWICA